MSAAITEANWEVSGPRRFPSPRSRMSAGPTDHTQDWLCVGWHRFAKLYKAQPGESLYRRAGGTGSAWSGSETPPGPTERGKSDR